MAHIHARCVCCRPGRHRRVQSIKKYVKINNISGQIHTNLLYVTRCYFMYSGWLVCSGLVARISAVVGRLTDSLLRVVVAGRSFVRSVDRSFVRSFVRAVCGLCCCCGRVCPRNPLNHRSQSQVGQQQNATRGPSKMTMVRN